MKITSSATVVLAVPSDPDLHIKVAAVTDVLPCPNCGGTEEAILILVGPDHIEHGVEYTTLIYPCGFVLGGEDVLGRGDCHHDLTLKQKKELQHG